MQIVPLSRIKENCVAQIVSISKNLKDKSTKKHLQELGFVRNQNVTITNQTKDLLVIKLGPNNKFALLRQLTDNILVKAKEEWVKTEKIKTQFFSFQKLKNFFMKLFFKK